MRRRAVFSWDFIRNGVICLPENRRKTGKTTKFQKGQTGNPGGRPKLPEEFRAFAKEKSMEALKMLYEMMIDPNEKSDIRIKCGEVIISYGVGKPQQSVDLTANGDIKVVIEYD